MASEWTTLPCKDREMMLVRWHLYRFVQIVTLIGLGRGLACNCILVMHLHSIILSPVRVTTMCSNIPQEHSIKQTRPVLCKKKKDV